MSRQRSASKAVQFKHESAEEEDDDQEEHDHEQERISPRRGMHSYGDHGTIGSGVPAFLAKLWRLVDDGDTNHLICWTKVSRPCCLFTLPFSPFYQHGNNNQSVWAGGQVSQVPPTPTGMAALGLSLRRCCVLLLLCRRARMHLVRLLSVFFLFFFYFACVRACPLFRLRELVIERFSWSFPRFSKLDKNEAALWSNLISILADIVYGVEIDLKLNNCHCLSLCGCGLPQQCG